MFLNYPNNPTGATADLPFFEKVVGLARSHNFVVAQDAAYNEMYYEKPRRASSRFPERRTSPSNSTACPRLQHDGLADRFRRSGSTVIAALGQIKANTDSGVFTAIQFAGRTAIDDYHFLTAPIRALYKERRDAFLGLSMRSAGKSRSPRLLFTCGSPAPRATNRPSCVLVCSTRPTS